MNQVKSYILILLIILLWSGWHGTTYAQESRPISVARPTWDTGWFHVEIMRELLMEMGYEVKEAKTFETPHFFEAVARGETDFWLDAWMPAHKVFLTKNIAPHVEVIGLPFEKTIVLGFLIDKTSAQKYNIQTLQDLKKPEIAKLFDLNGNGKADLLGCEPLWACHSMIEHMLDSYDLRKTVEHISDKYAIMTNIGLSRIQKQLPVIVHAWDPHWLPGMANPGQDSYWLPVPFISLPEHVNHLKHLSTIKNVEGCRENPCKLGIPSADLSGIANKKFLEQFPDIKKLIEQFQIPNKDISKQNARLYQGEDSIRDIKRHAKEWIVSNRTLTRKWLQNALKLQKNRPTKSAKSPQYLLKDTKKLKVAIKEFQPFVILNQGQYTGFSVDLWKELAKTMEMDYELYGVTSLAKLLDEVDRKAADIGLSGISITSKREENFDFSYPILESGLQILVRKDDRSLLKTVFNFILSPKFLYVIAFLGIALIIVAHLIWFIERKHNDQFSKNYFKGIMESLWWTAVTMTTVGYGDKIPIRASGKLFAIFWMFSSYFIFAYFTATVTTTFTMNEMESTIRKPEDLTSKKIVTVAYSISEQYLRSKGLSPLTVREIDDAYLMLANKEVDAVVYHAPALKYYATHLGKSQVEVAGLTFHKQNYGLALQSKSELTEEINHALLELIENGTYQKIHNQWFGR